MKSLVLSILLTLHSFSVYSWDGYRWDNGSYIDVESYDHRGNGEGDVEYFDYGDGKYKTGYMDMFPGGDGEITDDETGETFEVDMD